ncbi:MAG: tetratricopeptide repeat protein [Pirellulales bacterium]|nr:tetratricopeptide repeat protein [Pirellulales bacterium]
MARDKSRQRKLERKAKKAAKRRQRVRQDAAKANLSLGAARGLDEADELLNRGEYDQAVEVLEELGRRYPRRLEILSRLAETYFRTNNQWSYQATCARLVVVDPDEPMSWLVLGSAALGNGQAATAQRAFAHLAATWPDHPESVQARQMQESLREFLADECRRRGLDEESGVRVLLLHDEVNLQLHLGNYDKTCDAAARLLTICPTFAPALNNRSEAHFRSARYGEAITDCQRVLQFDSTNYQALANLTRYLYLSGRFDEAQTAAAALKACEADEPDAFLKKAEAFALRGDWEAVRQAVRDGQSVWSESGGTPGLAEHLAAVASANLGDLDAAREHWRRAKGFAWASANLEDSQRPGGSRHGPWAFPLESWLPRGVIAGLVETMAPTRRAADVTRLVRRHFERYPQVELLADLLLQRSDPSACELLIRLAPLVKRPAIFAALKSFALGERGSDELRMQTLVVLTQAGHVEGEVQVWREGKPGPMLLMSQEIFREPTVSLPPEINDLMVSAYETLRQGRAAEAERLFDKILRLRPDDVSVQYNRAVALGLQGRKQEALEIIRRVHRDQPDYVFARTHLADECIAAGDLEGAKSLLAPIAQKRRLHASEYAAWCSANINLALAMCDPKAAKSFLSAWEQVDPDDDRIEIWKERVQGGSGLLERLKFHLGMLSGDAR